MRKFHLFLYGFIFTVLTIAVFVIGCGGGGGGSDSGNSGCTYPNVQCHPSGKCCDSGYPYHCADKQKCYKTYADAVAACGGSAESCGSDIGGGSCKDGCGTNDCSYYRDQLTSRCHTVSGGIEYVGGLVPGYTCCSCPGGTSPAGTDNVSTCHPWTICTCN